jgi:outer membrane protein assembly factor BamA
LRPGIAHIPPNGNRSGLIVRLVIYTFLISSAMSGCTGLGKLSEGQSLVAEYNIDLQPKEQINRYKDVRDELKNEITQNPNGKFLWMRPMLAFHNTFSEPKKEKGLKYWLKYKIGKAPVLLDETYCEQLNATFVNRLYHKGHFNATSSFTVDKKGKTASVSFAIDARKAYVIDTLILPELRDTLTWAIRAIDENSLVTPGEPYQLETLKRERARIDKELKNMGFYYFNPDYIKFLADTSDGENKVKLKMDIKEEAPANGHEIFTIDKIYVAEDYHLENYHPDTTTLQEYEIVSATNYMKPKHYLNSVLYTHNSTYSKQSHNNSLKQLTGLQAYKYVNVRYAPSGKQKNMLDAIFMMTPAPKMSISTELNAVTKSNSFAGPGIKLTFNSKNFFRGAELFSINLNGRFEKQISGDKQGDTAYEISIDANLDFPRLIPFKLRKRDHPYLPNSNIVVGTGIFARVSLYKFNTFTSGLSYSWKKNEFVTHTIKPIDISVTNLIETTDEFEQFLKFNPSIQKSFEEQFIFGGAYNFIINKLSPKNIRRYYFNVGVDPSGNFVSLASSLLNGKDDNSDETVEILGQPVSQYFRIRTDLRYYFKTGKESIIATRLYAGVGVPYGNSEVMPYIKQFYAGGTNSLRAFRARSLGPGSYIPPDSLLNVLVDQTGEIRLETNIEYRFPIAGFLKGSLFADIGNVWLVNDDPLRPGGKFDFSTFHKQAGAGLGFGLRVDVNLMVLRLDWAFPVRKPWLPEGERWTFDQIDVLSKAWRKDNLLWNISIGYPF